MNKIEKDKWLRERKNYIGGSDIAAILGLKNFGNRTALDIFLDKTSDEINNDTNTIAEWGVRLEPTIAEVYSGITGLEVEIHDSPIKHPKYPFLAANIDRWVDNKNYVLECKTASAFVAKKWGEEGTDQIPDAYLCQVAWYRAITNVEKVDIAVLIGGNDFRIYTYRKDKDFEDKLIRVGHNFWINHVLKKIPPAPETHEDMAILYARSNGKSKTTNELITNKIDELKVLKEENKIAEDSIDKLKLSIKEFMADNEVLLNEEGDIMATWKNTVSKTRLNTKKLKEECESIYLQYTQVTQPSRILLIK